MWHRLTKEHGTKIKPRTTYHYLGKLAARLQVPRPSHIKKDAQAEAAFRKGGLSVKFKALSIPRGVKVRLWVMDDRFAAVSGIILAKPDSGA